LRAVRSNSLILAAPDHDRPHFVFGQRIPPKVPIRLMQVLRDPTLGQRNRKWVASYARLPRGRIETKVAPSRNIGDRRVGVAQNILKCRDLRLSQATRPILP